MALNLVSDLETLGRERNAAALQLTTGIIAEAWLDPLALTASTWLDPLSLNSPAPRSSAAIRKRYLNFSEAFPSARCAATGNGTPRCVPGLAGESACRANDSKPVRVNTYRVSPNAQPQNKTAGNTPVPRRDSSPAVSPSRTLAAIDSPHFRWMATLVSLAFLSAGVYVALPAGAGARLWPRMLFGLAGTGLMLFCGFLPVRKRLLRLPQCARWRILRCSIWETGHSYLGLLSCLVLHFHADFRMGGPLTSVLLGVLWAVIGTGLVELLFRRLLVLTKAAKEGKGLLAAQIIATTHAVAQEMHGPLTGTLFTLGTAHAVMALFY